MELCSMLYSSLDGRGVWGKMYTCVCMAESLSCSPETNTKPQWLNSITFFFLTHNSLGQLSSSSGLGQLTDLSWAYLCIYHQLESHMGARWSRMAMLTWSGSYWASSQGNGVHGTTCLSSSSRLAQVASHGFNSKGQIPRQLILIVTKILT